MSKVTLVFEGATAEELCSAVCEYVDHMGKTTAAPAVKEAETEAPKSAKKEAAPAKAAKPAKKEAVPAEVVADEAPAEDEEGEDPFGAAEESEPETSAVATFEQVNAALEKVGKEKGIPKVREIVKAFGVKTVKTLPEDQYVAVLKACKKALG